MQTTIFLLSSSVPAFFFVLALVLAGRKNALIRILSLFAALILSIPIGVVCVGASIHLVTTRGVDHSPGIGVAFIPLILVWLACVFVMAILSLWAVIRPRGVK